MLTTRSAAVIDVITLAVPVEASLADLIQDHPRRCAPVMDQWLTERTGELADGVVAAGACLDPDGSLAFTLTVPGHWCPVDLAHRIRHALGVVDDDGLCTHLLALLTGPDGSTAV